MKRIVQNGESVLREVAAEVDVKTIKSSFINDVIHDMKRALQMEEEGVAIAAPQIGVSLRMFVVAGKVFGEHEEDVAFINPVITKSSKTTTTLDEGCLSVRGTFGGVKRHNKVTVRAYDTTGKKITMGASGLLAQIFQHEIDHLDGILFIDKADNLRVIADNEKN